MLESAPEGCFWVGSKSRLVGRKCFEGAHSKIIQVIHFEVISEISNLVGNKNICFTLPRKAIFFLKMPSFTNHQYYHVI